MKLKKKKILQNVLIIYILSFLVLSGKTLISIVGTANNFQILMANGETINFQHMGNGIVGGTFTVSITVLSGTLNGTNANLRMWNDGSGELSFINLNATTLSAPLCAIYVNGDRTTSGVLAVGDRVIIRWGISDGWFPILAIMGLTGLGMLIVTPTIAVYQIRKNKDYLWVVYALILMSVGYSFLIAWVG